MNSRESVIQTLEHREVDRIPRDLWAVPGVRMYRKKEYDAMLEKRPVDFTGPVSRYGQRKWCKGNRTEIKKYNLQAVWNNIEIFKNMRERIL
jgi:hypothetical protein